MNKSLQKNMINVARQDLNNINKYSAKDILKDTAKRVIGRPASNRDMLFWPAGMLLLGLTDAYLSLPSDDSLKGEILEDIKNYVDTWAEATDEKISYVDDALAGLSILSLFTTTGDKKYLSYAGKIYDFLCSYPKDKNGSIIYNRSASNDYIFADGVGETVMFLSRFSAITRSDEARTLAKKQLENFHRNGMDKLSGLPYHAFSSEKNSKLGLLGWGRACGWLFMGYGEYINCFRSSDDEIKSQFIELSETLLKLRRPDGGFSWHVPSIEGAPDTSAASMIAYGFSQGLSCGIYGTDTEKYNKAVLDATAFIEQHTKNGSVNDALSGCEDLGVHRQVYGHFPWGQGAALALISSAPEMV